MYVFKKRFERILAIFLTKFIIKYHIFFLERSRHIFISHSLYCFVYDFSACSLSKFSTISLYLRTIGS